MLNLLLVNIFFVFLVAILMTTLLSGKFYKCHDVHLDLTYTEKFGLIKDRWDCLNYGGEWVVPDHNFDNTAWAMITLYVVSSLEGWPDIMIQTIDMTDVNLGPSKENAVGHAMFYIIFIFIGSFFFLNFFVGVLFL